MTKIPTLTQCFSALVASGDGQRCNDFRAKIKEHFLVIDDETGQPKSILFKYGQKHYGEAHKKMRQEMGEIISSFLVEKDNDLFFFGDDIERKSNVQQQH